MRETNVNVKATFFLKKVFRHVSTRNPFLKDIILTKIIGTLK